MKYHFKYIMFLSSQNNKCSLTLRLYKPSRARELVYDYKFPSGSLRGAFLGGVGGVVMGGGGAGFFFELGMGWGGEGLVEEVEGVVEDPLDSTERESSWGSLSVGREYWVLRECLGGSSLVNREGTGELPDADEQTGLVLTVQNKCELVNNIFLIADFKRVLG